MGEPADGDGFGKELWAVLTGLGPSTCIGVTGCAVVPGTDGLG